MLTVAVRSDPLVFASAVNEMISLPEPEVSPVVNHVWSEETVHVVFEVMVKVAVLPFCESILRLICDTESVAGLAF